MPKLGTGRRLTKRVVDALQPGNLVWDTDVPGFGVRRRTEAGAPIYALKVRAGSRQRWITIGRHGSPWTVESARNEARRLLGDVARGIDPGATRGANRNKPTIAELTARYLDEHVRPHRKPSTIRTYEHLIRLHIDPVLGKIDVADLTLADVDRLKRSVATGKTAAKRKKRETGRGAVARGGKGAANRTLACLSNALAKAERWGWRQPGTNPVRGVERYTEKKRERFLSEDELQRLGAALQQASRTGTNKTALAALWLLALTGARKSEILNLRWDQIDEDNGFIRLADSKTGPKIIHLNTQTLAVIEGLDRLEENPFVLPGTKEGKSLVNVEKTWRAIRKAAALPDLRIHDLRHTFASVGAGSGLSLPILGKLLGHSQSVTTERYAHLAAKPLREANESIGKHLHRAMTAKPKLRTVK